MFASPEPQVAVFELELSPLRVFALPGYSPSLDSAPAVDERAIELLRAPNGVSTVIFSLGTVFGPGAERAVIPFSPITSAVIQDARIVVSGGPPGLIGLVEPR